MMGDFFLAITEFFASFIGPKGGKGTQLPEEYRPKEESVQEKQHVSL